MKNKFKFRKNIIYVIAFFIQFCITNAGVGITFGGYLGYGNGQGKISFYKDEHSPVIPNSVSIVDVGFLMHLTLPETSILDIRYKVCYNYLSYNFDDNRKYQYMIRNINIHYTYGSLQIVPSVCFRIISTDNLKFWLGPSVFLNAGFATSSSANHGAFVYMWGVAPEAGLLMNLTENMTLTFETGWKYSRNYDNSWSIFTINESGAYYNTLYLNAGMNYSIEFHRVNKKIK